jgi:tRNA threonylcarbamoyladenosine biosynthesis protein TsaB
MSNYILCIDTALSSCSVAIFSNEKLIASAVEINANSASEKINLLIENVLAQANIKLKNLVAVAITNGPGSYTGLRISAAIAKAIAFSLEIPVIAISTLDNMFHHAFQRFPKTDFYLPNIDARRLEIFFSLYDSNKNKIIEDQPKIIDEQFFNMFEKEKTYTIFGNATAKIKSAMPEFKNIVYIDTFESSAIHLGALANEAYHKKKFVDLAYFEPNYTKPFFLYHKN